MKTFNVTAQVYSKFDPYKQTILMNEIVLSSSEDNAKISFQNIYDHDYKIIKIYSVEEISQGAA